MPRYLLCLLLAVLVAACSKGTQFDSLRPHHTTPVEVAVQVRIFGPLAEPGQPIPEVIQRLSMPMLHEGCDEQLFMPRVTVVRVDLDRSEPLATPTYKELRATFDKPAGMDVSGDKILERAREKQQGKQAGGLLVQPASRVLGQSDAEAELARQKEEFSKKNAMLVLTEASQQEHFRKAGADAATRGEGMSKAVADRVCVLHAKKAPMALTILLPPPQREAPPVVAVVPSASTSVATPAVTPSQLPLARTTAPATTRHEPRTAPAPRPSTQPTQPEAKPGTLFLMIGGQVAPPQTVQLYQRENTDKIVEKNARKGYAGLSVSESPPRTGPWMSTTSKW